MINEVKKNPSWPLFLIDLDLAIREERDDTSGVNRKTGTRAFIIYIHYEGPGNGRVIVRFDKWNFVDIEELASIKKGEISDKADFMRSANEYFIEYYRPLILYINTLRKAVFPNRRR
ncbi:hypothetical protein N7524_010900 [Penicillium chrysogenum]|nr:hypothetical protein N7524_010900 [Penicillium chrysogenum]